jgi:hypothetical protein
MPVTPEFLDRFSQRILLLVVVAIPVGVFFLLLGALASEDSRGVWQIGVVFAMVTWLLLLMGVLARGLYCLKIRTLDIPFFVAILVFLGVSLYGAWVVFGA